MGARVSGTSFRLWRTLKALTVAVLAATFYLACTGPQTPASSNVPAFELPMLGGGSLVSTQLQGKVHILNFFATWCGPCKAELPDLKTFYAQQDPARVALILVAAGSEHRLDIRAFVDQFKLSFPVALEGEMLLSQLGGSGLPSTVILDEHGHVQHFIQGMIDQERLTALVKPLLEKEGATHPEPH